MLMILSEVGKMKLIIGGIGLLVFCYVMDLLVNLPGFLKELRIVNMEIGRNDGRAQKHWKKKKRRLILSLLPFVKYK